MSIAQVRSAGSAGNGEWKTLSSDKVGKTGFIENVYANQIAFGRLYREKLKEQVEALGYETEVVGKHGMWEIPDNSVQPGAGNGEPVTAEVLAQRQAEEAIRRETERRADEIVRKMAENKPDLPDGKTEQAVRDIAGLERDRSAISEREAALPESVLREPQRVREAVREVARENLLQERLQQMERDMVRDLQKEKTLGGD
ncbi:TPA: relaxase domain-containing protein [Escherichia coli]|nr:relaxase domain-containing protein [Escherichia coli]